MYEKASNSEAPIFAGLHKRQKKISHGYYTPSVLSWAICFLKKTNTLVS
jgi:hypothetical protein